MVQFGHTIKVRSRTRGTVPGVGDETQTVVDTLTMQRAVHSYGWYLRQYAADVDARGEPDLCDAVPRNYWLGDGTMNNTVMAQYGRLEKQVADGAHLRCST